MFDNVGQKLKNVAFVVTVIGIAVSIIFGILIITTWTDLFRGNRFTWIGVVLGLVIAIGGCLASWVIGVLLFAYGELVHKTSDILSVVQGGPAKYEQEEQEEQERAQKERDEYEKALKESVLTYPDGSWDCPVCSKHNPPLSSTCYCGFHKE